MDRLNPESCQFRQRDKLLICWVFRALLLLLLLCEAVWSGRKITSFRITIVFGSPTLLYNLYLFIYLMATSQTLRLGSMESHPGFWILFSNK